LENIIKRDDKETTWDGVEWIALLQGRENWWDFVNTAMSTKCGTFLE
jgi:hypothetical protein